MSIFASRWNPEDTLTYWGSSHLPDADGEIAGGWADLAEIPNHVERDGQEYGAEGEFKPYLRLSAGDADGSGAVILTVRHARDLHRALGSWLESADAASGQKREPSA